MRMNLRPISPDYTGRWCQGRFLAACEAAGIPLGHHSSARRLADLVNEYRCSRGIGGILLTPVAKRWLTGEQDPSIGAAGKTPSAYDIAGALGVSLDWLLGGKVQP